MSRNDKLLLTFGGFFALGAWLWYTKSGRAVAQSAGESVSSGVTYVEKLIRGERNNNPGNIRISSSAWKGKIIPSTDSAFEQFDTVENGIRALAILLKNYQKLYGLDTVRKIISRWAPASENDTGAYTYAVSAALGVAPDTPIDMVTSPTTLVELTKAIIKHENGRIAYSNAVIIEGVRRAFS